MGISNPVHLAFVAIIALLVLGPKRLPDLARSLGSGMREFRESLNAAIHDDDELSRTVVQPIPAAAEPAAAAGPAAPAGPATPFTPAVEPAAELEPATAAADPVHAAAPVEAGEHASSPPAA